MEYGCKMSGKKVNSLCYRIWL